MSDLDDLFDLDDLGKPGEEKKPEKEKPTEPTAPAPAKPKGNDDLLSDFDALFADNKAAAPSAETTEIQEKAASGSLETDDLFEDFLLNDAPAAAPTAEAEVDSATAKTVHAAPPAKEKTFVEPDAGPEPAELEDLFSDSASPKSVAPAEPAEAIEGSVDPSLTIHFGEVKKRRVRIAVISALSVASLLGAGAFAMARLSPSGFLGWKWGQKAKDGYEPPSAKVLEQLNAKFAETDPLIRRDADDKYAQAIAAFEQILKVDPRHAPTMQRAGEALLMRYESSIDDKVKQTVDKAVADAQKFHPGTLATLRLAARAKFAGGNLAEAAQAAQAALQKSKEDPETLALLGEIAYRNGDWDTAMQYLEPVAREDHLRARYVRALTLREQGKAEEAEAALRELFAPPAAHAKSQFRLLAWKLAAKRDLAATKDEIVAFLGASSAGLSRQDAGDAWTLVAGAEMELGNPASAIGAMENAMKSDPVNHAHAYYLGRLYLTHREPDKAVDQLAKAAALAAKNPEYLIAYGQALREGGKPEVGIVEIKKALDLVPDSIEAIYQQGLTLRRLLRIDEAMSSFEAVLARKPDHVFAAIELGELYVDKNNFQAAEAQFRAALSFAPRQVRAMNDLGNLLLLKRKNKEALEMFRAAEATEPANVEALSNLGKAYLILEDRARASTYFERALAIEPNRVETQQALGDLHREGGEYAKATEIYRKLIEQNPKNYEARIRLAMCHIAQESFQEAITELQEASKYKADYFPIKLQLGIAWRGLGDLDTSLETLRTALGLWPESPEGYYQLEVTYIYRGDIPSAEDAMRKAVKFDAAFIEPYVAMGDFFRSRNLYDKAIEYYQPAIKIRPRNANLLYILAELYKAEKRYALAKKHYQKTVEADPTYSLAYVGLGLLAEEDHQIKVAIQHYQKAKKYDPKNPRPYYYLGFIYRDMGNRAASTESFAQFLELDPNSKEREDILDQIRLMKKGAGR